ncbi:hybrid sensor histidine kinase/response regulator, partial [Fulvivirga lutimaris]|uniref:hybrid sensor histidine kinase/response regulator n=1 Tax=Fulvivirga lutimaris TaxID=1819566 RepID=UPI0012BBBB52
MNSRKILIVDDEWVHLEAIIEVFENTENNYKILQALGADIAMEIAINELPDLIITDWEMPGTSGIDLIRQLKSNKRTSDIPIIMCSGIMTSSENLMNALEAGAIDYIRKPIDSIELIARTKTILHLADSYSKIKSLNDSKDKFFSIISHDLKEPINSISSFTGLLKDHIESLSKDEIQEMAGQLHDSQKKLYTLLENLLEWSRSQMGLINLVKEDFNITAVIDDCIELLAQQASNKKIDIVNHVEGKIIVNSHKNSISTVIRNLISNAIKFTQENGNIEVSIKEDDQSYGVYVKDSGVGISDEAIKKIFQ